MKKSKLIDDEQGVQMDAICVGVRIEMAWESDTAPRERELCKRR
jgi:hypothetical protein